MAERLKAAVFKTAGLCAGPVGSNPTASAIPWAQLNYTMSGFTCSPSASVLPYELSSSAALW